MNLIATKKLSTGKSIYILQQPMDWGMGIKGGWRLFSVTLGCHDMMVCMTPMHIKTWLCLKFTLGYHDMILCVTRMYIRTWHPNVTFRVCVRYVYVYVYALPGFIQAKSVKQISPSFVLTYDVERVYKIGFTDELTGRTNTATHTQTKPCRSSKCPVRDKIPIIITGIQQQKSVSTMTNRRFTLEDSCCMWLEDDVPTIFTIVK